MQDADALMVQSMLQMPGLMLLPCLCLLLVLKLVLV